MNPNVREAAHARARGRCEGCGARYSRANWEGHVHHLTYERYGEERLSDVVVLCLDCHAHEHPHHTFRSREEHDAAKRRNAARREARGDRFGGDTVGQAKRSLQNTARRIEGKPRKKPASFEELAAQARKRLSE